MVRGQDVLNLARTAWRCTTSARLDDPPRQGYEYFHPIGRVKMAQVVPESNRERANTILWWRTREEHDFEDPTGRLWADVDWLDARSPTRVDRGETDPFALGVQPAHSRSTMTCELRPGWLQ